MSFTLSKAVNPAKVFLVGKMKVTSRWDPHYYRPEFIKLEARIRSCNYSELHKLTAISTEQWDQTSHFAGHFPYVEISNIDPFLGRMGPPTPLPIKEAPSRAKMLIRPGDLLVSMTRPTRGAICFVEVSCPLAVASNGFAVIRNINSNRIIPRFLFHTLRSSICLAQFDRNSSGGNYPAIAATAFNRVLIPLPELNEQKAYSKKLDACYQKVEDDLEKASHLIATIDDVLLDELGIPHQTDPPNTLKSRIFRRRFSSLSGKRMDPASNWKRLSLASGKFPMRKLRDVVEINPPTRFPRLTPETLVSFVPMEAVSDVFGEIADPYTRPIAEAGSYTLFQNDDVIWAKITPCMENGKSAVAEGLVEGIGYGSTEFHVFRRRTSDLEPQFLHHLLRLKTVRQHARLNFTGSSGHQRVDEEFFHRLEVPFPPTKVQERIAEKAEATKRQARNLFADARAELEKAKREIEALILGKEGAE